MDITAMRASAVTAEDAGNGDEVVLGFPVTATRLDLDRGRRLCVQGARRQEFGRVISGRARVVRDGVVVDSIGAGDHFGEFTMLRGLPSPVTIVTEEPTIVDVLTAKEFRATVGADPANRDALERVLGARLRRWVATPDPAAVAQSLMA